MIASGVCGWMVARSPLLRADYAFRAVALDPGSHKVKFLYHPFTAVLGLALSIIALLGAVSLICVNTVIQSDPYAREKADATRFTKMRRAIANGRR
jgi:hypothetical protein